MKREHCISLLLGLAVLSIVLLTGCASGRLYTDAKNSGVLAPPAGRGLALIYFTPGFAGGGQRIKIYANDQPLLTPLRRGGFYDYDAEPGQVLFSTTPGSGSQVEDIAVGTVLAGPVGAVAAAQRGYKKDQTILYVEPNQIYYLELRNGFWREYLEKVSTADGEKGIRDCHWLNPPGG